MWHIFIICVIIFILSLCLSVCLYLPAAYISVSDLYPWKKQPPVCWNDNQPHRVNKQLEPTDNRLQTGQAVVSKNEDGEGRLKWAPLVPTPALLA